MDFEVKDYDKDKVEIKTNVLPSAINEYSPTKVYEDPKKQLNPAIFSVFKHEKIIRVISIVFWTVISAILLLTLMVAILKANNKIESDVLKISNVAVYILTGIGLLIALPVLISNLIKYFAWIKTEKTYRNSYTSGQAAANNIFAEMYKSITLKDLRMMWLFIFFLTYFGLFIIVLALLANSGTWEIGKAPEEGALSSFHLTINWKEILDRNFFGDVYKFLIVCGIILGSITILFAATMLYDKKRILDFKRHLDSDSATILAAVASAKRAENKAWLRTYIIVFILVILLPLALITYLVFTKVIRRKK